MELMNVCNLGLMVKRTMTSPSFMLSLFLINSFHKSTSNLNIGGIY